MISLASLEKLLGKEGAVKNYVTVKSFVESHTQNINPFIIALILFINSIASNPGKNMVVRSEINNYLDGLFQKIGEDLTNIPRDNDLSRLYLWNRESARYVLQKQDTPENIWSQLTNILERLTPEMYDSLFSEAVLKCILGEKNQDAINRVIQFAANNKPSFNKSGPSRNIKS